MLSLFTWFFFFIIKLNFFGIFLGFEMGCESNTNANKFDIGMLHSSAMVSHIVRS